MNRTITVLTALLVGAGVSAAILFAVLSRTGDGDPRNAPSGAESSAEFAALHAETVEMRKLLERIHRRLGDLPRGDAPVSPTDARVAAARPGRVSPPPKPDPDLVDGLTADERRTKSDGFLRWAAEGPPLRSAQRDDRIRQLTSNHANSNYIRKWFHRSPDDVIEYFGVPRSGRAGGGGTEIWSYWLEDESGAKAEHRFTFLNGRFVAWR